MRRQRSSPACVRSATSHAGALRRSLGRGPAGCAAVRCGGGAMALALEGDVSGLTDAPRPGRGGSNARAPAPLGPCARPAGGRCAAAHAAAVIGLAVLACWPSARTPTGSVGRQCLCAGMCARPGPLEVVAAQPAGDVHHLADEIQARLRGGLHGLLRERARVDAAQGHLGLLVAFGPGRRQLPSSQLFCQPRQGLVGGLVDGALPVGALLRPGVGQAAGDMAGQLVGDELLRPGLALG